MTREAKTGLLVALAFLLVVGILLSDHVAVATREPLAPLASLDESIRGSVGVPGIDDQPAPPLAAPPSLPAAVEPAPAQPFTYQPRPTPTPDPWAEPPVVRVENAPATTLPPQALAQVAEAAGQPVETVRAVAPAPASPKLAGVVEYVAQPGDVLSKIVARHLGRWTPENREIFLRLNPSLRDDPDLIVVGRAYIVPRDAAALAALQRPAAPVDVTVANVPAKATAPTNRTYTVRPGDTLYRIAAGVLGDPGQQDAILKLNAAALDDPDHLSVGQVLKLPA